MLFQLVGNECLWVYLFIGLWAYGLLFFIVKNGKGAFQRPVFLMKKEGVISASGFSLGKMDFDVSKSCFPYEKL